MKAALPLVAVALTACAHLDVHDMGNGQHWLTAVAASGGYAGSHEEAVERANAYCLKSGRQAAIDSFFDKSGVGPYGEHASSVIFSCAAPKTLRF